MHVFLLDQKCHSLFFHLVLLLTPSYVTHGLLDFCLKACRVCTQCLAHSGSDEAFTGRNNQINNCIRVRVLQREIVHMALVRQFFFFFFSQHINHRLTWVTMYSIRQWCQNLGRVVIYCAIVFFLSILEELWVYYENISHLIWYWLVRVTSPWSCWLCEWLELTTFEIKRASCFWCFVFCFCSMHALWHNWWWSVGDWVWLCIFESKLSISALSIYFNLVEVVFQR